MELAAGTTTASAKTSNTSPWEYGKTGKYAWSAPKDDAAPLYYTNTKKNGYIWNKIFTKNCTISKTINILHGTLKNRSNVTEKCITRLPVIKYQDMYGTAMLPLLFLRELVRSNQIVAILNT
ncbi:hypothetical protein EFS12_12200 [Levilactobacillus brevis]|nr:hypothetical protein A6F60_07730 [Levilactobacillus brevis]MCS8596620.1 hypothetical protein [Levilactobacillus brevis]MCT2887960.1 hypothetical protein [Levilactobacillus brevis]MCT3564292.1 hypothetical protein [Levilactobacillus brevis]MCT3570377.1 hypothetical protein [Levilactobacillus brevis]